MRRNLVFPVLFGAAFFGAAVGGSECRADGQGVLVQALGDRLMIGAGDDSPGGQEIGQRVFGDRLPSSGINDDPSFFSLSPPPGGLDALPVGGEIFWDFLPITIDGVTANLFHWDSNGAVDFAPATAENLSLFDVTNTQPATVDGSAAAVPGARIGTVTNDFLSLHAHRFWSLQGQGGDPAPGIYLTSLRLRLDGFTPSEPFFVALATSGTSISALNNDALPWIESNIAELILEGDFNFDGLIGASDYALWRDQYGATASQPVDIGEADGNGDGRIDAADYTVWRDNLLAASITVNSPAVPEPSSVVVVFVTISLLTLRRRP